ncbi:MAG TPA: N-acetyl sugar amidotransferase [Burkholderiales bacterium]|nr:N-acetyl sugar amidotransferase [Burkholderiales bacterium]
MNDYGKPLYPNLRYCVRCCMPETNEGVKFDEMGICQACQAGEQKIRINWVEREKSLRDLLESYRSRSGTNYDCIVPISGGKDSTFQLYVLTQIYGMKPLAVTFNHNWYTETGKYNLQNALEQFNVDHVMFTPNRSLVNRLAKSSLYHIGDSCWHCHSGVGAFPLQVAVRFNIPLLIWGESIAEDSGRATYRDPVIRFDRDYFTKVSAKKYADEMVSDELSAKDLHPFELPSVEDIERVGVVGIHLGDYIFWDDERQMEFVRDNYQWREDKVEGTYKGYKSVECKMAGVHDYMKFVKRGFGRGTDHASQDVRAGLLTREEGFELAKKHDQERPGAMDMYVQITGIPEEEVIRTLKSLRQGKAKDLP